MTITPYDIAERYLGMREYPGTRHNPVIVGMSWLCGHEWVRDDELSWCASFVGSVAFHLDLDKPPQDRILSARSWLDVGEPVKLKHAQPGWDIVVLWRGSPDSWKGHVGFYAGHDHNSIRILGGNQSNAVSIQSYPRSRLLGVRRLTA